MIKENRLIRCIDFALAAIGLILFSPLLLLVFLIGLFDTASPLFRQVRVGRYQKPFTLFKFRTMHMDTTSVASHLVNPSAVTKIGGVLRKSKLDELPQLWNVLIGDMSLVGPRPCLYSQVDLIEERAKLFVFDVRPGITGLAQVQGINMATPKLLAETDKKMIDGVSIYSYFKYIIQTILGAGRGDGVSRA
jgi:O-antigen biosynthesis protein WbqP